MTEKYKQQNLNFDKISNIDILQKRTHTMPIMMDGVMLGISSYLTGGLNRKEFIISHTEKTVPLYKRIEMGNAAQEYQENYTPEIMLIKSVSEACYKYSQNKLKESQFDSIIENAVEDYITKEIKRNKNFVI